MGVPALGASVAVNLQKSPIFSSGGWGWLAVLLRECSSGT
jgi:hypothetical protein